MKKPSSGMATTFARMELGPDGVRVEVDRERPRGAAGDHDLRGLVHGLVRQQVLDQGIEVELAFEVQRLALVRCGRCVAPRPAGAIAVQDLVASGAI